jgi:hypothetical protein
VLLQSGNKKAGGMASLRIMGKDIDEYAVVVPEESSDEKIGSGEEGKGTAAATKEPKSRRYVGGPRVEDSDPRFLDKVGTRTLFPWPFS